LMNKFFFYLKKKKKRPFATTRYAFQQPIFWFA
jgi:hypothetical protein